MPKVSLGQVKPGMVLRKAVTNRNGMVLLAEGTELTPELIERLNRMELESVHIRGDRRPDRPMEALLSELDARFARTVNEPHMTVLKDLLREHIIELYKKNGL